MNAIEVENLTKVYHLGTVEERRYKTLRDTIARIGRQREEQHSGKDSNLLALNDVSFVAKEGEAIGIIGRNGAGKSTLLKILSRITAPTSGHVRLFGRVASLLEVGTGFHPELTGRENIFLNGAILGMTRDEIKKRFDEMVAFAAVERFLDTPVKRYSSGMFVRLAFSVAAHLTPEILIVDEVLAVGDHEFQKRCLGRMHEIATSGRTVLFVSHNTGTIETLCNRCVLLKEGRVQQFGPTSEVLAEYLSQPDEASGSWDFTDYEEREGTSRARITRLELVAPGTDNVLNTVDFGASFGIRLHFESLAAIEAPTFGFALLTEKDERVFLSHTPDVDRLVDKLSVSGFIDCTVRNPNVLPGVYRLEAWITDVYNVSFADHIRLVGRVEIVVGRSRRADVTSLTIPLRGRVRMDCAWSELQLIVKTNGTEVKL